MLERRTPHRPVRPPHRRQPGRPAGRRRARARRARAVRQREVVAAARGGRPRTARRRPGPVGRPRPRRRAHPQARLRADVPGRPALRPPDRRAQRRLRAAAPRDVRRGAGGPRSTSLLELVGLGGYGDRLPRTLSGGERQRVALARSLAAEPRLLLLDEPLSALDAELRVRLAADLRRILREAGTTALLVTHDQEEAFAVADRLAVMRDGAVVQQGTTEEVWARTGRRRDGALPRLCPDPRGQGGPRGAGCGGPPGRRRDRRTALGAGRAPRRSVAGRRPWPGRDGARRTRHSGRGAAGRGRRGGRRGRRGRGAGLVAGVRAIAWCCGSTLLASLSCRPARSGYLLDSPGCTAAPIRSSSARQPSWARWRSSSRSSTTASCWTRRAASSGRRTCGSRCS